MPADTPTFSPAALARCLPFAVFMALLALRGYLPDSLGLDARWIYGLQTFVVGGMLAWYWREYGELVRQTLPVAREAGLAVVVGLVVFALWVPVSYTHLTLPTKRIV